MTDPIEGDAPDVSGTDPQTPNENAGKTLVKTPGMLSSFSCPDGSFPTVTPKGVHMDDNELKAAKRAAKASRIKLTTDRGQS